MSEEDDKKELSTHISPISVANELRRELATMDIVEDREDIIQNLKDHFIATRLETSSLQEQVKSVGILKLLDKLNDDKLSFNQLVRVVELLGKNSEIDVAAILGVHTRNHGTQIVVNNNPQTAHIQNPNINPILENSNSSIKQAGEFLEAISGIKQAIEHDDTLKDAARNIIDVTPDKDD